MQLPIKSITNMIDTFSQRFYSLFSYALVMFALNTEVTFAQIIPRAPDINALSYLVLDADTGSVLIEKNADQALPPASLTKIMTVFVADKELALGNISLQDEVPVSVKAWQTEGSKMFIQEGSKVRLEDLLRGIIIQSGNDASIAVAEHVAGSEDAFTDMMNQYAQQLNMSNSHFMNASGLPDVEHYMSARDLATLARAAIMEFPETYAIYGEREFTYNDIRQPNRNSLLFSDNTVDGMKTGHTEEAGYCLVASALRDGMRLITVVMGTESMQARAVETQKLLTYGFRFFETHEIVNTSEVLGMASVVSGTVPEVKIGASESKSATLPRGSADQLDISFQLQEELQAPVSLGQHVGTMTVTLEGQVYYEGPVVALENIDKAGLWQRFMDWLYRLFISLFS
jgi:D-alanyl-D-alanine carboxypeptidase (penicillin-binding protein 5/6)